MEAAFHPPPLSSPSSLTLHLQGAAEIVLAQCERFLGANGQPQALSGDKRAELYNTVTQMAQQGLRTLCLAYRDFPDASDAQGESLEVPPEEGLTACCIVGIKVPLSSPPHQWKST